MKYTFLGDRIAAAGMAKPTGGPLGTTRCSKALLAREVDFRSGNHIRAAVSPRWRSHTANASRCVFRPPGPVTARKSPGRSIRTLRGGARGKRSPCFPGSTGPVNFSVRILTSTLQPTRPGLCPGSSGCQPGTAAKPGLAARRRETPFSPAGSISQDRVNGVSAPGASTARRERHAPWPGRRSAKRICRADRGGCPAVWQSPPVRPRRPRNRAA